MKNNLINSIVLYLLLCTICMQAMSLWTSPLTFRENERERQITSQCHCKASSELTAPRAPAHSESQPECGGESAGFGVEAPPAGY